MDRFAGHGAKDTSFAAIPAERAWQRHLGVRAQMSE
jgi:hypothetical protein